MFVCRSCLVCFIILLLVFSSLLIFPPPARRRRSRETRAAQTDTDTPTHVKHILDSLHDEGQIIFLSCILSLLLPGPSRFPFPFSLLTDAFRSALLRLLLLLFTAQTPCLSQSPSLPLILFVFLFTHRLTNHS